MSFVINCFAVLGVGALGLFIYFVGCAIIEFIRDITYNIRRKRQIKKRFRKPPTAKCYCRDCQKFEPDTGKCWDGCNSRLMNPTWFCCFAEPLKGERYKKRDEQMRKDGY